MKIYVAYIDEIYTHNAMGNPNLWFFSALRGLQMAGEAGEAV